MTRHALLSVLVAIALVLARDAGASPGVPINAPASPPFDVSQGVIDHADYERALRSPPAPVAEQAADGSHYLYYGRVFARSRAQSQVMRLFGFSHDLRPFFDEYDATKALSEDDEHVRGKWIYAIGTGRQWNVLITTPGLVAAVELNPRSDKYTAAKTPHPMLDRMLVNQPGASLDRAELGRQGFNFPAPPKLRVVRQCTARPNGIQTQSLWDTFEDIGNAVVDGAEEFGKEFIDITVDTLKKAGKDLATVLKYAYDGVKWAIDELRKLGNLGVCAITGKRSHSGRVYVTDPLTGTDATMPYGPRTGQPEPLRGGTIRARGGPGGVLLTTASIEADGQYHFDDFCGDITYTLALSMDSYAAWITSNGYTTDQTDLGEARQGFANIDWHESDDSAVWLLGAQIGHLRVLDDYGFLPEPVKIAVGWFPTKLLGGLNGHRAFTPCGELSILAGILAAIPYLGWAADVAFAPLLGVDMYLDKSVADVGPPLGVKNPLGVVTHEYGHFAMCRGIDQAGGDIESVLDKITWLTLKHPTSPDTAQHDPLFNTWESFADHFAYRVRRYTNYFPNSGTNYSCDPALPPCLEPDTAALYPPNPDDTSSYRALIQTRTSVMYDWTDTPATDDDTLSLPPASILSAAAANGTEISTEHMSLWLSARFPDAAEGLCTVYDRHGWPGTCAANVHDGTLEAPKGFDGVAVSTTQIAWSWSPTSRFADSYVVMNQGGSWSDVGTVSSGEFRYVETVSPGGNQSVTAAVEARRAGAKPGRSARQARCTLANAVTGARAEIIPSEIVVSWPANGASSYTVQRAEGSGSFVALATVPASPFSMTYYDVSAAPGASYRYRIDANNCDGVPNAGTPVVAALSTDDASLLFVRAGATGGDGSRAAPFGSIGEAFAHVTAARNRVAIATGTYAESTTFEPSDSALAIFVYGGYDATFATRDAARFPTIVVGSDASPRDATWGTEIAKSATRTVFWFRNKSASLDGLTVAPGRSPACAGAPCVWKGLAVADGDLRLANVQYDSVSLSVAPTPLALYASFELDTVRCAKTCTIVDSTIAQAFDGANGVLATDLVVAGSTVTAGTVSATAKGGLAASAAGDATIDRSVLRAGLTGWEQVGTTALDVTLCAAVTNSIVTGATSLQQRGAGASSTCSKVIGNSLFYGTAYVNKSPVVNNVFITTSAVALVVGPTGLCLGGACTVTDMSGYTVSNNLFVPVSGQSAIVRTRYLDDLGRPALDAAAVVSGNPVAWFGFSGNDASANRVVRDATTLFVEPLSPMPSIGVHVFHPLPGGPTRNGGRALEPFGVHLTSDLDGAPRPSAPYSVGPYAP